MPRTLRHDRRAGIAGHDFFDAGADERRFGLQKRNRLTLHVRTHERPVRVVVFKERNQRGRDRHQLFRRHVDQVDLFVGRQRVFAGLTGGDQLVLELALVIEFGVGLRHDVPHLFGRGHIDRLRRSPVRSTTLR